MGAKLVKKLKQEQKIKWAKIAAVGLIIIVLIYLFIHLASKPVTTALPSPRVIVQKPASMKIGEYVTQTGNTVAYNSVNLVARVEGYLDTIKFTDGTYVKKGQNLFIIEPDTYLEQLDEAQATVAVQKASYEYNKAEAARQRQMYKENATSLKNVEKWDAQVEETKAEVAKAEANEKIAEINYSYTQVNAPFDGRIGRHLVDVGNLVGHGEATKLAVIEQISPIYVYFNLNELDLIKLRNAARAIGFKPSELDKIPAFVGMQDETGYPHKGKLDFVNTGLNASTGTMEIRAILPNENHLLVPGLFVKVRIPLNKPIAQLAVPDAVVQYDQIGPYLLIVDKNQTVVSKRVTLGGLENGMRAITKGLTAEDDVIVEGVQFAVPGNKVNPNYKS